MDHVLMYLHDVYEWRICMQIHLAMIYSRMSLVIEHRPQLIQKVNTTPPSVDSFIPQLEYVDKQIEEWMRKDHVIANLDN